MTWCDKIPVDFSFPIVTFSLKRMSSEPAGVGFLLPEALFNAVCQPNIDRRLSEALTAPATVFRRFSTSVSVRERRDAPAEMKRSADK